MIEALHLKTEGGREVLFVADHDVHILGNLTVDLARFGQAADGFPERGPVVQVVAHDGAVAFCSRHRFDGDLRRRLGQRCKDAACVKPPGSELAENVIPVVVAGFQLRGGTVPAIWISDRAAYSKASLGKIQAISHGAADAVIFAPFDKFGIHAALHDKIFDQVADFVVHQGGADSGAKTEAFAKSSRCVVFAAALPSCELAGSSYAALAGIEAQHHLTEGDLVVKASGGITECE